VPAEHDHLVVSASVGCHSDCQTVQIERVGHAGDAK
jgi:hypothetical protein